MTAVFVSLLALSTLLTLLYLFLVVLRAQPPRRAVCFRRFWLMLVCPVIGPAYMALSKALYRLFYRNHTDLAMTKVQEKTAEVIAIPDADDELNVVSIEEAMIVSHKSDLRRLLLNILKDGADHSLDAIALALDSEDSEASHYSASAIADSLARFHEKVRVLTEQLTVDGENEDCLRELVEYLLWYLDKNVLSEREQKMYLHKTSDHLLHLMQVNPAEAASGFFSQLTELAIKADENELAATWAQRCAQLYPDNLDTYAANLHSSFANHDVEGFRRWMEALKHSKVVVNKEMLDLIHTFG